MTTIQVTTIPDVIDALISTFRAMTITSGNPPVAVYDGYPGARPADRFIIIGGWDPLTADGTQDWASLGIGGGAAPSRNEQYTVNCAASAFVGGEGALGDSTTDAQKRARDQAFDLYQACDTALVTDPRLIVPLGNQGLGNGWVLCGGRIQLEQTDINDPDLELGRRATVLFQVLITNRLYST